MEVKVNIVLSNAMGCPVGQKHEVLYSSKLAARVSHQGVSGRPRNCENVQSLFTGELLHGDVCDF